MNDINRQLFDFIEKSPSAFHAVKTVSDSLKAGGYCEFFENRPWSIEYGGKYFVKRNDSSIIAFRVPEEVPVGFMIMSAHSDSPTYKLKDNTMTASAGYARFNVERYGGMIACSWMDRPLSIAGRVTVRKDGRIVSGLVDAKRDICLIPGVAIHMDRTVNDGKKFDPNIDMLPLAGIGDADIDGIIAELAGCDKQDILSKDMFLYPRERGCEWGMNNEFISSPRLDDLQCVFGCMKGFISAGASRAMPVLAVFDNEEVGSGTKQGADSTFLDDTLLRVCEALNISSGEYRAKLANSFMVSADNAHAVHPNHPEYADRNDRPMINGGIVIKHNANQKYTTDSVSSAVFSELCSANGVKVQHFTNRGNIAGGSTLGNISNAHVSLNTVDIGLPQLAMHSCYETAGSEDTGYLIKAAEAFFSASLETDEIGIKIV